MFLFEGQQEAKSAQLWIDLLPSQMRNFLCSAAQAAMKEEDYRLFEDERFKTNMVV